MAELVGIAILFFIMGVLTGVAFTADRPKFAPEPTEHGGGAAVIDRQHGKLIFECDSCPEVLETPTADFSEAWELARADGWKAKRLGTEWLHGCGKCGVPT